jgi:hypothetical protein
LPDPQNPAPSPQDLAGLGDGPMPSENSSTPADTATVLVLSVPRPLPAPCARRPKPCHPQNLLTVTCSLVCHPGHRGLDGIFQSDGLEHFTQCAAAAQGERNEPQFLPNSSTSFTLRSPARPTMGGLLPSSLRASGGPVRLGRVGRLRRFPLKRGSDRPARVGHTGDACRRRRPATPTPARGDLVVEIVAAARTAWTRADRRLQPRS